MMRAFLVATFALVLAACGSGTKVGETCTTAGAQTDQCGEGGVCTPEGTLLICRVICEKQEECGADEECNGLTGNVKSCQPKTQ